MSIPQIGDLLKCHFIVTAVDEEKETFEMSPLVRPKINEPVRLKIDQRKKKYIYSFSKYNEWREEFEEYYKNGIQNE